MDNPIDQDEQLHGPCALISWGTAYGVPLDGRIKANDDSAEERAPAPALATLSAQAPIHPSRRRRTTWRYKRRAGGVGLHAVVGHGLAHDEDHPQLLIILVVMVPYRSF